MSKKINGLKSQVIFSKTLPPPKMFGKQSILIYDKKLLKVSQPFECWAKGFSATYPVVAGERLKSVENFSSHIGKILALVDQFSVKELVVVVAGGGSVGDFGGFVASVLKRGVRLVHCPTTWLAAIDSSHGGKTALNVKSTKNQIGTFYSAESVYLSENILVGQPKIRAKEAMGELVKMALLDGNEWAHQLESAKLTQGDLLWKFLPKAVKGKYKVVEKDPKETTGYRGILNLGHTLGHILESHYGLAHGISVGLGLHFAVDWSREKGLLSKKAYNEVLNILELHLPQEQLRKRLRPITKKRFMDLALRDKKRQTQKTVQFIFLKGIGRPVIKRVTLNEFYKIARKKKWVL